MANKNYAFQKGFSKCSIEKSKELKTELMIALNITSYPAWLRRLRGEIDPKTSEIQAVEVVFHRFGIKQIWGE